MNAWERRKSCGRYLAPHNQERCQKKRGITDYNLGFRRNDI